MNKNKLPYFLTDKSDFAQNICDAAGLDSKNLVEMEIDIRPDMIHIHTKDNVDKRQKTTFMSELYRHQHIIELCQLLGVDSGKAQQTVINIRAGEIIDFSMYVYGVATNALESFDWGKLICRGEDG